MDKIILYIIIAILLVYIATRESFSVMNEIYNEDKIKNYRGITPADKSLASLLNQ